MIKITASDVLNCNTYDAEEFLDLWVKMAKAASFVPPITSNSKRFYEIAHSMSLIFQLGDTTFVGNIKTECSAKTVYCSRNITENGEIKKINNLKMTIKKIKEYVSVCPKDELPLFINSKYKDTAAKRLAATD